MPDFETLGAELRAAAAAPPFTSISRRSRHRRRWRAGAAIGASALVVAGLVVAVAHDDRPDTAPPVAPTPTSSTSPATADEAAAQRIIDDPRSDVIGSVDPEGDVLATYELDSPLHRPRDAAAIRTVDGRTIVETAASSSYPTTPVEGGWITSREVGERVVTELVTADGVVHPLPLAGRTTPRPGDVPVHVAQGVGVYRPSDGRRYGVDRPPLAYPSFGVVTASGTLAVVGNDDTDRDRPGQVALLVDGAWHRRAPEVLGPDHPALAMAGNGDHVAIVTHDSIAVSDDGADTWHVVHTGPTGSEGVSVAVSADGTVLESGETGSHRVRPDGRLDALDTVITPLFAVGGRVYGVGPVDGVSALQVTTDDGDTWRTVPYPR